MVESPCYMRLLLSCLRSKAHSRRRLASKLLLSLRENTRQTLCGLLQPKHKRLGRNVLNELAHHAWDIYGMSLPEIILTNKPSVPTGSVDGAFVLELHSRLKFLAPIEPHEQDAEKIPAQLPECFGATPNAWD